MGLCPGAAASRDRAPVVILLHGAGGDGRRLIENLRAEADASGFVLLAPKSAGRTWDMIEAMAFMPARARSFRFAGGDSARIQRTFAHLRQRARLTPGRVALAGFSDGASFALSLGPAQPGLYDLLIGFSPGFIVRPESISGRQPAFVAHGRADPVLSFERSGERVASQLGAAGHPVTFHPFDGGHFMPPDAVAAAFRFLAGGRVATR